MMEHFFCFVLLSYAQHGESRQNFFLFLIFQDHEIDQQSF